MAEIWGAALGAAAIGAGASIYAGDKAAGASKDATGASIAEQRRQYDLTRSDFAGQRSLGNSAMDHLARLYGYAAPSGAADRERSSAPMLVGDTELPPGVTFVDRGKGWHEAHLNGQYIGYLRPGGGNGQFVPADGVNVGQLFDQQRAQQTAAAPASAGPDMGAFFESPDYQFNLGEGQKAIDRSLVARGRGLSGAGVREGVRYASGMASQQYGDFTNRLLTMAGLGSAATSNTASAGQNMANNNSAAMIANGQARGSAYTNMAAGVNNSIQGGVSNMMLMRYLNKQPTTPPVMS